MRLNYLRIGPTGEEGPGEGCCSSAGPGGGGLAARENAITELISSPQRPG